MPTPTIVPIDRADAEAMHRAYLRGGAERSMAPHVVDTDTECPHIDCDQHLQAIDFRPEDHGRAIHDPLVAAWWRDTGFAGRCPGCGGWIHFTVRGKRAIDESEARSLPKLPDDWHADATIL